MERGEKGLVILCRCRGEISQIINLDLLADSLSKKSEIGRIEITDNLCEEFDRLIKLVEKASPLYVVVGCCSPQLYGSLFRRAAVFSKLNPFMIEVANLREQCALPHSDKPELATEKARLLILAKLERVKAIKKIPEKSIKLEPEREISRGELLRLSRLGLFKYKLVPYVSLKGCLGSICKLCAEACPIGALKIDGSPLINKGECRGCGICVKACPFGFIRFPTYDPITISKEAEALAMEPSNLESRIALLVCDQGYKVLDQIGLTKLSYPVGLLPIHLPCGGMISVYELLLILSRGFEGVLIMACADCPYGSRLSEIEGVVSGARKVLDAFGLKPERIDLIAVSENQASMVQESLSNLFERIKGLGASPLRLRKLSRGFHELMKGFAQELKFISAQIEHPMLPVGILEVNGDKCTLCMTCAACPLGAFEEGKLEGAQSLIFSYDKCVGCGLCGKLCPEAALKVRNVLDMDRLLSEPKMVLVKSELLRCPMCGKPFVAPTLLSKFSQVFKERGVSEEYGADIWNYCNECRPIVAVRRLFLREG